MVNFVACIKNGEPFYNDDKCIEKYIWGQDEKYVPYDYKIKVFEIIKKLIYRLNQSEIICKIEKDITNCEINATEEEDANEVYYYRNDYTLEDFKSYYNSEANNIFKSDVIKEIIIKLNIISGVKVHNDKISDGQITDILEDIIKKSESDEYKYLKSNYWSKLLSVFKFKQTENIYMDKYELIYYMLACYSLSYCRKKLHNKINLSEGYNRNTKIRLNAHKDIAFRWSNTFLSYNSDKYINFNPSDKTKIVYGIWMHAKSNESIDYYKKSLKEAYENHNTYIFYIDMDEKIDFDKLNAFLDKAF